MFVGKGEQVVPDGADSVRRHLERTEHVEATTRRVRVGTQQAWVWTLRIVICTEPPDVFDDGSPG